MKRFISFTLSAVMMLSSIQPVFAAEQKSSAAAVVTEETADYTQFVDPFVGTDVDYGQLFPGSVVPYGLMKLSPDTYPHDTIDHAGYDYTKNQITGFSHTRVEGVGGQGAGGDILVTPTYVRYTKKPSQASRAMDIVKDKFDKKIEDAKPGYYTVNLKPKTGVDDDVREMQNTGSMKAELTSDIRTGYHRYTLPEDGEISLTVDMKYTYHPRNRDIILNVEKQKDKVALSGRFSGCNVGGSGKYTMYFYLETNQPALEVSSWDDSGFGSLTENKTITGDDIGAVLTFMGRKDRPLEVKTSISPVSAEQAKRDMEAEMPGWNFKEERQQAKQAWNDVLGRVKVTSSKTSDPDGRLKKLFYTHLYHMFTMPMNATSTDGTFRDISTQNKQKAAEGYTHYDSWTLWDDFKKYPIVGLVLPDVYADVVRSIADGLEAGFATWSHDYQVVPNIRTEHAVALLADGVAKGMTDIPNLAPAYENAKKISDGVSDSARRNRVDKMVEYCYDDWAISLLAKELYEQTGDEKYIKDYEKYAARAFLYKELFRPDAVIPSEKYQDMVGMGEKPVGADPMGLLWGKESDGSYRGGNPERVGDQDLYQGSLWQYTFWDTNDVSGLMDLMGGKDAMYRQLSYLMGEYAPEDGSRMLHTSDNEIDLHSPYLFNYTGRPDRTQYWTRQIYTDKSFTCGYTGSGGEKEYLYKLKPDGYLHAMDDDAGTMASAFVAAGMGLFPITPGDPTFQITSPFFEEIRLDVGNGREFVIKADNTSPDNKYIQSASLNGQQFDRTWLSYEEISRGGVIQYEMADTPSDWASDSPQVPSMSDMADSTVYEKEQLSYSSLAFQEAEENDGSIRNSIDITVQDEAVSVIGKDQQIISGEDYSVTGVPKGLGVKLLRKNDKVIEMVLEGKADEHRTSANTDKLKLELKDTLFEGRVTTKRKNQFLKVQFKDNRIVYSGDIVNENEDGNFDDTITATIFGDADFVGGEGEDFVQSGKAVISGLPQGMKLTVTKTGARTADLNFTGKITGSYEDRDGLKISFLDTAFKGSSASDILGSNYGGMKSIRILSSSIYDETQLRIVIDQLKQKSKNAREMDYDQYTTDSVKVLLQVLDKTDDFLANEPEITLQQANDMLDELDNALNGLAVRRNGYEKIELEKFDAWSSELNNPQNNSPMKTEGSNDPSESNKTQQVANTFSGAWLKYGMDFGDEGPDSLSIRYAGSNNCYSDSAVEIRLGSVDGETIAVVSTPPTGSWGNYTDAKVTLDEEAKEKLTGEQNLYLIFTGTHQNGSKYYAGNFNWMLFEKNGGGSVIHDVTKGALLEAEAKDDWDQTIHPSGNGPLKTEPAGSGGSGSSVANTFDKAWLKFGKVNFGSEAINKISINYKTKKGYCPGDSRLELRIGAPDGELAATIMAPEIPTGGNWSSWQTASAEVTGDSLKGIVDDVYLMFRGDMSAHNNWYIFNLDHIKFEYIHTEPAYDNLELENFVQSGDGLNVEARDNGKVIANVNSGEGLKISDVDFGDTAPEAITVRYAGASNCHKDANFEIRLGSKDGELISRVATPPTGSWDINGEIRVQLENEGRQKLTGVQDIYILFGGSGASWVGNFNWIRFERLFKEPVKEKNYGLIQAERMDDCSQGVVVESADYIKINDPGSWLKYDKCLLDGNGLDEITLRYSANTSGKDTVPVANIYFDNMDKEKPDLTIPLPATTVNGDLYKTVRAQLDVPVAGEHALYLVVDTAPNTADTTVKLDWIILREENEELQQLGELSADLSPAKNKADIQMQMDTLFIPLRANLLKAERILNSVVPDKNEVSEVLSTLQLLERPIVETLLQGELSTLIQVTEALDQSNTAQESLDAIAVALAGAKTVTADDRYTVYADAFDGLKKEYDNRKPTDDKLALSNKIDDARNAMKTEGEYLESSKARLKDSLSKAEIIMNQPDVSAEMLEQTVKELDEAMNDLVPMSDLAGLEMSSQQAEKMIAGGGLLPNAREQLEVQLDNARLLISRAASDVAPPTNEEYSIGKKKLDDVIAWAVKLPSAEMMSEFQALVTELSGLDLNGYTEESGKAVADALKQASLLGEEPFADELVPVLEALRGAKAGLEADKSELLQEIANGEAMLQETGQYSTESVNILEQAVIAAKAIYDKTDASAADVAKAAEAVRIAAEGLAKLESIQVIPPVKTQYNLGETADYNGMEVIAVFADGSREKAVDYQVEGFDTSAPGARTVKVYYYGKRDAFSILVNEPKAPSVKSIKISKMPQKTAYKTGEYLNLSGMVITAEYSNGKAAAITDYAVEGWDFSTAGTKVIRIRYGGHQAEFKVTVTELTYKISYILNGGKNSEKNPGTYTQKEYVRFKKPTRKGYLFDGWYRDRKFKNRITQIAHQNCSVYAKWKKVSVQQTSVSSLKKTGKTTFQASVKRISGAKGYEIRYSTNSKLKNSKKAVFTGNKITLRKLKNKKTYFIKVRAYKLDSAGKKVYGKYSKAEKIKL